MSNIGKVREPTECSDSLALCFLPEVYIGIQSSVNTHKFSSGGTFDLGYKENINLHAMYTLSHVQEGVKTSYF